MANSFGHVLRLTTAGESHGPAMVAIVDGCPAGLRLDTDAIQVALDRRRPGQSHWVTQRQELDRIQVLSGVFRGQTTGSSIALLIENQDAKSKDYSELEQCFRPGHADFTYQKKYGIRDHRGGGRASARETAMWVAAGDIARQLLQAQTDIQVYAGLESMGQVCSQQHDWQRVYDNDCYLLDASCLDQAHALIQQLRRDGDSIGGRVLSLVTGMPAGLGEPVFAKLDARIAQAMMGINAVKAVEIGDGIDVAKQLGSQHRDAMGLDGFDSNHAGGILGGISSGQDLRVAVSVKPPASIRKLVASQTHDGDVTTVSTKGRHDCCVAIRAVPVVQAMMQLVLADHWLLLHTQIFQSSRIHSELDV